MKSLKKMLAMAGAAVGAAAIVLAAALPASASTQGAGGHGNYEWINGFLAGPGALANAPVVPLQLRGAVNTRGSINLGGNGSVGSIPTYKGTLAVEHGNPSPPPQLNYRTCRETSTISTWYQGGRQPEQRRLLGRSRQRPSGGGVLRHRAQVYLGPEQGPVQLQPECAARAVRRLDLVPRAGDAVPPTPLAHSRRGSPPWAWWPGAAGLVLAAGPAMAVSVSTTGPEIRSPGRCTAPVHRGLNRDRCPDQCGLRP